LGIREVQMAKLRIVDPDGRLDVEAYKGVSDYFFPVPINGQPPNTTNFDNFLDEDPDKRADTLQTAVRNLGTRATVTQLRAPPGRGDEPISSSNCMILAEKDRRRAGKRRARVTVPIPHEFPPDVNFGYLEDYAREIYELYKIAKDPGTSPSENNRLLNEAHRYMFAVMMLTHCR
jgi:hypothetical protein